MDNGTFTILGIEIETNSSTEFEEAFRDEAAVGTLVEVEGVLISDDTILAHKLEAADRDEYRAYSDDEDDPDDEDEPVRHPDLRVGTPSVSDTTPVAAAEFRLSATVSNGGDGESAATTLRYYRSTDAAVSSSDTQVGTDAVGALAASATSGEWIALTAPSTAGTYYYGACVDAVTGESDTTDNCSAAVPVTVLASPTDRGQPATEVHLYRLDSVEENAGDVALVVVAWTRGNRAPTESIPVRVWLVSGTADEGVDFGRLTQSVEFNAADFKIRELGYEALKQLTITILDDTEVEGDETFGATMTLERARPFVTLLSPNYPEQLSITILANDAAH